MTIFLVTNDDGISAFGLRELVKAILPLGQILVVAPVTQRSGEGKSVTYTEPIRVQEEPELIPDSKIFAYSISGTPADAVMIGERLALDLFNKKPDFVLAGINAGDNTSVHAIFTSGTCAAALEGGIRGIPSIAFSLELPDNELFDKTQNSLAIFKVAAILAKRIIEKIKTKGFPEGVMILNINFPNTVSIKTKMNIVNLCPEKYVDEAIEAKDPRNVSVYWLWGKNKANLPINTDSYVLLKKQEITITPISLNLGDQYLQQTEDLFHN
jgi:5'-nucleotidase